MKNAVTPGQGTQDTTQGTVLPPNVPAKGMVDAPAHGVPELPPLALLEGSAGPEPQSQATNPSESLTFSVLSPCYCCSDFKNRMRLSHLKAKASQEG